MTSRTNEEKPKKRETDELYTLVIAALYNMIIQVTEVYNMGFDEVQGNIEQLHHGC